MPTFSTPDPIDIVLDLGAAKVDIVASDRADTIVTVEPTTPSKPADVTAAEQLRVEHAGGHLRIASARRWGVLGVAIGPGPESVDLRIEVPSGSSLRGTIAVGPIRTLGRLGEVELSGSVGDLVIEHGGRMRLKGSTGGIAVGTADGPVALTSSVGAIRVDDLAAGGTIKNSTGSVHVGRLAGELHANTGMGAITVEELEGSLVAKTAHGRVRVLDAIRGSVRVEGGYGEVEVAVHPGTAAWLDVASQRGAVRNRLTGSGAPAAGEDTVEIRARTSWGDISIHRTTD